MNVHTFADEYENLSTKRKREALHKLIDLLIIDGEKLNDTPAIDALVDISIDLEADDYFGTEGADI